MSEIDWRSLASVFDHYSSEENAPLLHAFYFWVVDQLDELEREPRRFVDVGCGTGLLAARLVEWYPEATFTLVDSSRDMLQAARERFEGEARVEVLEVAGEPFVRGLAPGSIDVVVFCRSLYTMSDAPQVARDVLGALAPEGRIFIYDFMEPIDLARLEEQGQREEPERWPVLRGSMEEFNAGLQSGTYRVYSKSEMEDLWESAGGRVIAYECLKPKASTHQFCIARG
jgi:SAM-dependent methyltransferase